MQMLADPARAEIHQLLENLGQPVFVDPVATGAVGVDIHRQRPRYADGVGQLQRAAFGQAGGHAEHVLFGYPHLEEPLRVGGLEDLGPRGTAHVAVQDEDPGVVIGQFGHGLTEDGTKGLAGGQRHVSSPRFGRPRFGRLGRKAQPMPLPAPGWSGPGCAIGSHLP